MTSLTSRILLTFAVLLISSLTALGQVSQVGTPLHQTDQTFAFAMGPNGDLFAIKKSNTGTNSTEVHIITAASGYQRWGLEAVTALHETDNSFDFVVAENGDVIAIKKWATGTGRTEIHVLTAASHYKQFGLQTGTVLGPTDDGYAFGIAPNRDIYAIKRVGVSSTEVHILDAASKYQRFGLQTGTALHKTDKSFSFLVASNGDLLAIKKERTGTKTTEVHVLTRASSFQSFGLQTGTALAETGSNFAFAVGAGRDVYAIKMSGTGTGKTEIHVLGARNNYKRFGVSSSVP